MGVFSLEFFNRNKNAEITLVSCPPYGVDMPPYGLASVASYLRNHKIGVSVYDMNIEIYDEVDDNKKELWKFQHMNWSDERYTGKIVDLFGENLSRHVDILLKKRSQIYAFSVTHSNALFTKKVIGQIKKFRKDSVIIVGGQGITLPNELESFFIGSFVDIFIQGYGEERLLKTINAIKKKIPFSSVVGIIYKIKDNGANQKGDYVATGDRADGFTNPALSLDEFVDYDLFALDKYRGKSLPVISSIGCIGRCNFCSDYVLMGKYSYMHGDRLFGQIKYYFDKYDIRTFEFNDLAVNGNIVELEKFCDLVISSNIKIGWNANCIPGKNLSLRLLKKMKCAGCKMLRFGIESGSDDVLKLMNKYTTKATMHNALKWAHDAGISSSVNILIGFPGETEKDFLQTLDFIKKNSSLIYEIGNLSTCFVTPKSALENDPGRFKITLPENEHWRFWSDSTGNDNRFRRDRFNRAKVLIDSLEIPIKSLNIDSDYTQTLVETKKISIKKEK